MHKNSEEDLKGAVMSLCKGLLKGACIMFYMIFCADGELIRISQLKSSCEGCICQTLNVSDTDQKQNPAFECPCSVSSAAAVRLSLNATEPWSR